MGSIQGHEVLRLFSIFSHHPSYVIFKKKVSLLADTTINVWLLIDKFIEHFVHFRIILATKSLVSIGETTLPKAIFNIF